MATWCPLPANFAIYAAEEIDAGAVTRRQLAEISTLKASLIEPEQAEEHLQEAYRCYQEALTRYQGVDVDDLIRLAVKVVETNAEARTFWQERFAAVAVDEYQDLNYAQYQLLRAILSVNTDLCVIGDADQAIYGFRGADSTYFLRFAQDFPQSAQIHLTCNYRCPANILKAATAVISHNPSHIQVEMRAQVAAAAKIHIYRAASEKAEAEFVVHTIERLLGGITHFSFDSGRVESQAAVRLDFGGFAILYRLHQQASAIDLALARSGMPYRIAGGNSLWQSPPMKAWKNLIALVVDPDQRPRLLRLLLDLPGVGRQTIAAISDYTATMSCPVPAALAQPHLKITAPAQNTISEFLATLTRWRQTGPAALLDLLELMRRELVVPAWQLGEEQWQCLTGLAATVADRRELLDALVLRRDSDDLYPPADKINVISLHAAKGLEFPVVFIIGCEDGLLPHRPEDGTAAIEEERRLFYVGMTRASQALYLLSSKNRLWHGQRRATALSPFLQEIPEELTEAIKSGCNPKRHKCEKKQQMEWF